MEFFIMRTALLALPLLALAPFAIAQMPTEAPGKVDPARVKAGSYTADASHTLVGWEVNHFGFNDYYGLFGDITGTLVLDPARPQDAKVDISIPIGKVTTASAGLTEHMLRAGKDGGKPDFFGPAPAPARFVSTSVTIDPKDRTKAKIVGNLTMNGVTKPVTLEAEFTGAGINPFNKKETVGFEAETEIKRSEWGIGYGIPLVGDDVELDISVAFEKTA
ncbi:MAG: YceI family protein [Sphingomonadaceae bacterium]